MVRDGVGLALRVEAHHHDHQQRQHEQRDRDDQPEQEVVEPDDVFHDRRRRPAGSPSARATAVRSRPRAAPPIRSPGITAAARAANRLSTSIVVIAPSTKSIVTRPGRTGGVVADQNPLPIRRPGGGRAPRQAVRREGISRASQTIIPAQSQCAWTAVRCDNLDILHILPIRGRNATAGGNMIAKAPIGIVDWHRDLAGRPVAQAGAAVVSKWLRFARHPPGFRTSRERNDGQIRPPLACARIASCAVAVALAAAIVAALLGLAAAPMPRARSAPSTATGRSAATPRPAPRASNAR